MNDKKHPQLNTEYYPALYSAPTHQLQASIDRMVTKDEFKQYEKTNNAQFAAIDQRFEEIDRRFEEADKRFERLENKIEALPQQIGVLIDAKIHEHEAKELKWIIGLSVGVVCTFFKSIGLF
ncbi:hypothetical protein [Staphylococcus argensis]|uniref:DUF1640 domain-containing protein n=1 Tax=Staphylococcus argensis TaxID=1607738 RepID=A0A2K4FET4_9STAP|nr:hypothetical protein [Staphylococcus argensis]MCY6990366.1 hypothetical protein [Staphylococcus argensis]POA09880.1 hypothetical protein CD039_03800 [Staphylococcus argensis]